MKTPSIYIVDDVQVIRSTVSRRLQKAGYPVVGVARDGQEAIEQAPDLQPDVILLDVLMPICQGIEALPVLRKALPDAIIIMLTSTSEKKLAMECKRLGADGYVIKNNDLISTIPERVASAWRKYSSDAPTRPGDDSAIRPFATD